MAKYTSEEKLQAAVRYSEGKESSVEIAKKMRINHSVLMMLHQSGWCLKKNMQNSQHL